MSNRARRPARVPPAARAGVGPDRGLIGRPPRARGDAHAHRGPRGDAVARRDGVAGGDGRAAARQLVDAGVGSLVVCRDGEPVGILTEDDLTELLAAGSDPETTPVAHVMAAPLVTVGADAGIEDAAARMREEVVKRLPVVEDGAVVGVVTTTDLSNFLPHLVRTGRRDPAASERTRGTSGSTPPTRTPTGSTSTSAARGRSMSATSPALASPSPPGT